MRVKSLTRNRFLPQPPRREVDLDDLDAYDKMIERMQAKVTPGAPGVLGSLQPLEGGDGEPDLGPYWGSVMNSPTFGWAWQNVARVMLALQDRKDSYSHADRITCNLVCAHYLGKNPAPTMIDQAVLNGLRLEFIEALSAERGTGERLQEQDPRMTEDERLVVTYIRQVIGGRVTDDIFERMYERMGRRGILDFTIMCVFMHSLHLLHLAIEDSPLATNSEVEEAIRGIREGTRQLPSLEDYRRMYSEKYANYVQ